MINQTELSKERAVRVLAVVSKLIVEACEDAGPTGMPANMLYLALSQHGMTYSQFEQLMTLLVEAGKVTKRHHTYFIVQGAP